MRDFFGWNFLGHSWSAPKRWMALFWDNERSWVLRTLPSLRPDRSKKLRKLGENIWFFWSFFSMSSGDKTTLKHHIATINAKLFTFLSYCRNWLGLKRSLIFKKLKIWRLIPLTNLHCLKQVVIFGATDHFFKQATRKNITRTIWISKKQNWNHPLITGLALLGSG